MKQNELKKGKTKIETRKNKTGYYDFYLNGKNITNEWMWFFSGLSSEEEKDCERLFINNLYQKNKIKKL